MKKKTKNLLLIGGVIAGSGAFLWWNQRSGLIPLLQFGKGPKRKTPGVSPPKQKGLLDYFSTGRKLKEQAQKYTKYL